MMKRLIVVTHVGTTDLDCLENELNPLVDLFATITYDEVCLAFTSEASRLRLLEKGREVFTLDQALQYGIKNKVKAILVVPLHVVGGSDYKSMARVIEKYRGALKINLMQPLLSSRQACGLVAQALSKTLSEMDAGLPIIFVGHGVQDPSQLYYKILVKELLQLNLLAQVITLETDLKPILADYQGKGIKKVVVYALFNVGGFHVKNDLFDGENSICAKLRSNDIQVIAYSKGLISYPELALLYKTKVSREIARK